MRVKKHRIALQGAQSSFHHLAAKRFYGTDAQFVHCRTFSEVCRLLSTNGADFAVMAIENALSGSILSNYELIRSFGLRIIGEEYIPVELHVMMHPASARERIRRIISHPVALSQCQQFFLEHPLLEPLEDGDTALCAEKVNRAGSSDLACIANEETAGLLGLKIIHRQVQGPHPNVTRFLLLSREMSAGINVDKASLSFRLLHAVGTLERVLAEFRRGGVNLSKIQSVPVKGDPASYTFHVDVLWDNYVDYCSALKKVQKITGDLCILGEYKSVQMPVKGKHVKSVQKQIQ